MINNVSLYHYKEMKMIDVSAFPKEDFIRSLIYGENIIF